MASETVNRVHLVRFAGVHGAMAWESRKTARVTCAWFFASHRITIDSEGPLALKNATSASGSRTRRPEV